MGVTDSRRIVVIAPNISEQMGGEAIKALQFIRHLLDSGAPVTILTHQRSIETVQRFFPETEVHYVRDSVSQKIVASIRLLHHGGDLLFFWKARRIVRALCKRYPDAVFHYLTPVSPIVLRFPIRGATNVLGPLTGNIYYPPAFRSWEPFNWRVRRRMHMLVQLLLGLVTHQDRYFARVMISGGERTRRSMRWAGCPEERFVDVVDSGISDRFVGKPVAPQEGTNHRFMTSGRLVTHKGVWLTIEALALCKEPVCFDIYGDGEKREPLERMVAQLGLQDRVRFLGWIESHDRLIDSMDGYRGYIMPSLAEANGIVVEEAMMAGLPVVCLKWGGPAMLADEDSAVLIDPVSRRHVVEKLASAMDRLARDPAFAAKLAGNARRIAERRFLWRQAAHEWRESYPSIHTTLPEGAHERLASAQ